MKVKKGLKEIQKRYVNMVEAAQYYDKNTYKQSFCCTQLYSRQKIRDLNTALCGKDISRRYDAILQFTVILLVSMYLLVNISNFVVFSLAIYSSPSVPIRAPTQSVLHICLFPLPMLSRTFRKLLTSLNPWTM